VSDTTREEPVDRGRATSVEIDAEPAAVLGYLFSFPAWLVVVLGEEENEFVRFHVFQSAAYNLVVGVGLVAVVVLWTGLVWLGSVLVFFLTIPAFVFAAAPASGAGAGSAVSVLLAVVTTLFVFLFGALFLVLAILPLVLTVAVLGYLVYVAYRASQGERYEMPYVGDFVEQYV
jgi:uncharacterized membrane protein